jgi:subtilisin family serine protease
MKLITCAACLGFLVSVSTPLRFAAAAPAAANSPVTLYLHLDGDPVAAVAAGARSPVALAGAGSRTWARAVQLQAQQAALQAPLRAAGAEVTGRFTRVANALRVRVAQDQVARIAALPGVRRVERARRYERLLTVSVPLIGAPAVWSGSPQGADGRGMRIGIVDSGIDYLHADFGGSGRSEDYTANDPTRIEPGSFPTAKVVGGFDFAGDAYNAADENHQIPAPDPDPLDCSANGHGTHVAGIAAGFGVLTNGQAFAGDYTARLDLAQFSVGPGVAPRAQLYALKVFGCTGSTELVTDALEWAADPNGDGDLSDRLDVVNLSLGGGFGTLDPEATDIAAANRLAELGCVVVCAAGNDENTFFAVGAPGVAERAIAVANANALGKGKAMEVLSPVAVAGRYYFVEGAITVALTNSGPVRGRLVYVEPNLGCESLANDAALSGNIALIDRGTCLFSEKIARAQAAGAIAVVMVNNQDTAPIVMGGDGAGLGIPGGMISKADGARLKAHMADSVTVRLDAELSVERVEFVDTLDDSSSRGPSSPVGLLKPELSAPGVAVVSAKAGSGHQGVAFTGTSMAAPTVAGAAALLRQLHPAWPVEDLKAALMNTAKPTHDAKGNPYPESRIGAGRLQVGVAARTLVTAAAFQAPGQVGLSFGALALSVPFEAIRMVRLTNHGDAPAFYAVALSNSILQPGLSFRPLTNAVTVPAHGAALVGLQLVADPAQFVSTPDPTTEAAIGAGTVLPRHFLFEASGQLWFRGADGADGVDLHVPFYVNARPASDFLASSSDVVIAAAQSTNATPRIDIEFRGGSPSTNFAPLVSAFELGALSPDRRSPDPNRAAVDLVAVGAASDLASVASFGDASVYFGLATAGSWTTPQPGLVGFSIGIDVNADGREDFLIENGNASATNSSGGLDVFLSTVLELGPGFEILSTNAFGYVNVYAADQADTQIFNNNTLVLSAPAAAIGLTEGSPAFRYKVRSFAPFGSVDETGWIAFNPARPAVDTAVHSPDGTPMHPDGQTLTVRLDREAVGKAGLRLPQVLLLHHGGLPGRRVETVTLDLRNDDTDYDRLPDWWEQQQFAGLDPAGPSTDNDNDGASDLQEFRAGTDPKDPKSAFKVVSVSRASRKNITVRWSGVAGAVYALERSTNLVQGFSQTVRERIEDTAPLNSATDTNAAGPGPFFYRVRLQN